MFNKVIKKVMDRCYERHTAITLEQAVKAHKGLRDVKWGKTRDANRRLYVTFSAEIEDVQTFYAPNIQNSKDNIETNKELTKILFELREYKKYMTLYDNAEDIFSYLYGKRMNRNSPSLLNFNYVDSNIRIYIHFKKNRNKEFIPISSGYSARLKVSKPDLGYFGGLFDDLADGRKCIARIYGGEAFTFCGAF